MAPDKYKIYLDYFGIEFGKSMAGSLYFLEHELFKEEINIENSSKYDALFSDVLRTHGLPDPHEGNIQYVRIFLSIDQFEPFFHAFEDKIMTHKHIDRKSTRLNSSH